MSDPPITSKDKSDNIVLLRTPEAPRQPVDTPCPHDVLVVDLKERKIRCESCHAEVDIFDKLAALIQSPSAHRMTLQVSDKTRERCASRHVDEAVDTLRSLWQSEEELPCCPHCAAGLMPEEFDESSVKITTRCLEQQRRQFEQ